MTDELTTSERDELMALRAQQLKGNNVPAEDKPVPGNGTTLQPTHWLHLANGDVVESNGVKSVHNGIQVIGAYEITNADTDNAPPAHVF